MPSLPENAERRIEAGLEVRKDGDGKPRLVGWAAVFNARSLDLGGFVEVIRPGAFARALRDGTDVRAFVDHDSSLIIGRRSAKTLMIEEDARGLRVEITPPETQAGRDVVENVRVGNLDGMSFAFRVPKGGDDWTMDGGIPVRELLDVDLHEVSVVALPAYPATDVALRSLAAFQAQPPSYRPSLAMLRNRQRQLEYEIGRHVEHFR
jgi:HK97 family phage prohead protease